VETWEDWKKKKGPPKYMADVIMGDKFKKINKIY